MDNTPRSPSAPTSWAEALSPFSTPDGPSVSLSHLNAHIDGAGPEPDYSPESAPIVPDGDLHHLAPFTVGSLPAQYVAFGEMGEPPRRLPESPSHWTPPALTGTTMDYYVPSWYDHSRPWLPYRPVGDIDFAHEHWWHHESGRPLTLLSGERAVLQETDALTIADDIVNLQTVGQQMALAFGITSTPSPVPGIQRLREAGPRGAHLRHWEGVRLAFYEWQGFIAWMLAHLPDFATHPNVIRLEWRAVLDHWRLGWSERIGTYLDLAQPMRHLPDIRVLIAHGARPRYVWRDAFLYERRLARLSPINLRAQDWFRAQADKEAKAVDAARKSRQRANKAKRKATQKKQVLTDDDWEFPSDDSMSRLDMRTAEEKARDTHQSVKRGQPTQPPTPSRNPSPPRPIQSPPVVPRAAPRPTADVPAGTPVPPPRTPPRPTQPANHPSPRSPADVRMRSPPQPSPSRYPSRRHRSPSPARRRQRARSPSPPPRAGPSHASPASTHRRGHGAARTPYRRPTLTDSLWSTAHRQMAERARDRTSYQSRSNPRYAPTHGSRYRARSPPASPPPASHTRRSPPSRPSLLHRLERPAHNAPSGRNLASRIRDAPAPLPLLSRMEDTPVAEVRRQDSPPRPESPPPTPVDTSLAATMPNLSPEDTVPPVWPLGPMPASIVSTPVRQDGYIFLDVRGQLRVMHWRAIGRTSSPTDDIRQLLRRGVPFTWRVPLPETPAADPPPALTPAPPPADWHRAGPTTEAAHEQALIALFLQPGAHRFLAMGGLAWRLALQYGPPTLVAEALQGPSHLVRVLRQGDLVGVPEPVSGDRLYPGEEDILIGRLPGGRSIWPSLSGFLQSTVWNGEWLPQNEAWFQHRRSMFSTPNMRTFTNAMWGRELRDQVGSANRRSRTGIGSSEHGQTLLMHHVEALSFAVIRISAPPTAPPADTPPNTEESSGS